MQKEQEDGERTGLKKGEMDNRDEIGMKSKETKKNKQTYKPTLSMICESSYYYYYYCLQNYLFMVYYSNLLGANKMKGTLYANPTFIRKPIRQPTLISIRPLVAYDQHRLYFNQSSIKWEYKDIVNCTFLTNCRALLVLTDDYKIYVFTEHLERITILHNWQPKYIVGFEMLQSLDLLLLIGTEEIQIMKVKVMTNIKRTKFLSSMKFSMRREYHLSVEPDSRLKWNRGYGYNIDEDLLYVWSTLDIHFFSLQKLTIKTKINSLTKKENTLSIVYYNPHYKYTVTGMLNGDVKVWRLPTSEIYKHKEILIHNFTYHTREIEHIIPGGDQRTIITAGVDMYVCFMSIETFQILRTYNFSGEYTKIFLCDYLKSYAIKESYLGQLNFGTNMEFITELTGPPIACDRSPHRPLDEPSEFHHIQITLSSNIGIELNLEDLASFPELNKIQVQHHYPPLKSKNIIEILSSPFEAHRYFLLVEDGEVFGSIMVGNSGKIDRHYIISKALDSEKHTINQFATCMRFFHVVPPEVDTEMMDKTFDKGFDSSYQNRLRLYSKLQLLAMGCSRGSVVFISTLDMGNIYCRVSYHRQKILNLQQVINKQNHNEWIISICEERYMKILSFEGKRANCILTIFLGQIYINALGFQEHLVLIMPKGVFEICRFESHEVEPMMILNREAINHEDDILSLDYRNDLKLIITSGKDCKIKIWTITKIQIYEVNVDQSLQYVLWASGNDVLVFMNNKLYGLRNVFAINQKEIANCEAEFKEDFDIDQECSLSQFISNAIQAFKIKNFRIKSSKRHHSLPQSPEQTDKNRLQQPRKSLRTEVHNNSALISTKTPVKKKKITIKTQQSPQEQERIDNDLKAVRKHIQELSSIKKATNETILPPVKIKKEDIFVEFMREKILNKKILTRRDITLNRIIMKNIIRDHLGGDNGDISNFKLQ